jgi:iron(III) transport system ATP-binding protein
MSKILELDSINFGYTKDSFLNDISFSVNTGEIACLLGPSGCGKSTLLRLIAGFEQAKSGKITINNTPVSGPKINIIPQQRNIGMLFQDLALFPHMTVIDNIKYGMRNNNSNRVNDLLALCRINDLSKRYPHELSGGQKQRVALARAMAPKPQLILLDEPFSSLDQDLKNELIHEVKGLLLKDNSTALWVTHSLEESCAVADHVGLILNGELLQWSSPYDLINHPKHIKVVNFTNQSSLIKGQLNERGNLITSIGSFNLLNFKHLDVNKVTQIAINHTHFKVTEEPNNNASVQSCVYKGSHYLLTLRVLESHEIIQAEVENPFKTNDTVHVTTHKNDYFGFQN